jgi:phage tail sheath protein FI
LRVSSLAQFRERFGAYRADSYLAYAVEGFFLNGGREAYVSRVAGKDSAAASVLLNNRVTPTTTAALRLWTGYRGLKDPGRWGERLRLDVRDDPRGSTPLLDATPVNATTARLKSLGGFRVGSVLRVTSGGTTFHRKIKAINPDTSTVTLDKEIAPALAAGTSVSTAEFRLIVRYQPTPTSDFVSVEDWGQLSMETDSPDYAVGRLNHPLTGSRYLCAEDMSGTTPSGDENPAVVSSQPLSGSVEGTAMIGDFIGDNATRTGLYAFDPVRVQLLTCPDTHLLTNPDDSISVVRAALDYCANRGDLMFVGSAPDRARRGGAARARALSDYTQLESDYVRTVKEYSGKFQAAKVYGALNVGFIRINDPAPGPAPTIFVPSDGSVCGVYARTEQERGIFKAPAGQAALLRGATQVSAEFTDRQTTELVRDGFVNPIRTTQGLGITISASRTLSTDTRWRFVNVRLLFNFVKSSLREGLRFVRQEPHSEELRRMVRHNVVTPFLLGLYQQGAFGSDPPGQVFTVKCNGDNNPPAEVDLGNFKLEVYFYPVRPTETIVVVVGQQESGATAADLP